MKNKINQDKIVDVCPHCGAYSQQNYLNIITGCYEYSLQSKSLPRKPPSRHTKNSTFLNDFSVLQCCVCGEFIIFKNESKIYPIRAKVQNPNEDMPDEIKKDYNEARDVFDISIRSSCALLRLALDKLLLYLGIKNKTLFDKINTYCELFKPDETMQKALHTVRIVGNESVHSGTFAIEDNKDIALILFDILNDIVYENITKKKKHDEIFNRLPKSKTMQIKRNLK